MQTVQEKVDQAATELGDTSFFSGWTWTAVGLLVASRLWTVMTLPLDGLRGYGDFIHFYQLAKLPGWPYLNSWVEFPPVFPFLAEILYRLAQGQEHVFVYSLFLVLMVVDAASLYLFTQLARRLENRRDRFVITAVFLVILCSLSYFWWYFDSLVVFFMLLSLHLWQKNKPVLSGAALAGGILTKFFPVLLLAPMFRHGSRRQFIRVGMVSLGIALLVFGALEYFSPKMTGASLASQAQKGSWETVWALIDGNMQTGNFGPETERLDPANAFIPRGNPARIPTTITLIGFSILGLWMIFSVRVKTFEEFTWMTGLVFCVFFLWSPGWSPQWILYLIPLILLGSPLREGILMAFVLILLNLLEWPVLLSRGYFWGLWLTVPMRSLLIILLGLNWFGKLRQASRAQPVAEQGT